MSKSETYMERYYRQKREKLEKSNDILKDLMPVFAKKQILKANLEYTGYGDSGDMWDITFYDKDGNSLEHSSWSNKNAQIKTQEMLNVSGKELELLSDALEGLLTYDYYNNEGGGGCMEIDFVNKTIELDAYYNETVQEPVSESEQTQSFDFS